MEPDSTICCPLSPNKQLYSPHEPQGTGGFKLRAESGGSETDTVEGQTSRDSPDPEVGISSIREAASDQDAGCVCVCA